ncbi:restriction endonuclease subunit S [Schaalia sp. JY-X169]|uniref:restriction endonuclease subunit S n=1 Tax=Schaalia sp. JY-X169 TaxID=2758572 RepID=UPI0015F4A126|nr:restriction endonuclease subunit S [Schaalia sp. JY-X169]
MSHIDDLIEELCPDGVEHRPLGQLVRIRNGRDHKHLGEGTTPVYGSGGIMRYVDSSLAEGPSVLIPRKGSLGNIFYVEGSFWNVDTIFSTEVDTSAIIPKFLYHVLLTMRLGEMNQAGGVPSQTQAVLGALRIPVPPLAVQQEIVRILDKFTALEAELAAELAARKKQYEHYRAQLLRSGDGIATAPLGTLAVNLDGQRRPIAKGARIPGQTPYFGASGIVDYVDGHIFDGDFLLVSEDGANLLARSTPIAFSASGKIWVNNHAHVLQFDTYSERRYAELYLNSIDLTIYISSAAQPKLNQANLNRIPVPCPSRDEKVFIVDILDKFDALVNDLSVGLPAELAARRKQYEYYRDRLLTFKELAA